MKINENLRNEKMHVYRMHCIFLKYFGNAKNYEQCAKPKCKTKCQKSLKALFDFPKKLYALFSKSTSTNSSWAKS